MAQKRLTADQLGRLLHKSRTQPRKNQKRYLHDLGVDPAGAAELDAYLAKAESNAEAVAIADRLDRERQIAAETIEAGVDGGVAEMIAAIRVRMTELELRQEDIAERCGMTQNLVSKYLSGTTAPGAANLAKLAAAVECRWILQEK